jgi:hypothetical protein
VGFWHRLRLARPKRGARAAKRDVANHKPNICVNCDQAFREALLESTRAPLQRAMSTGNLRCRPDTARGTAQWCREVSRKRRLRKRCLPEFSALVAFPRAVLGPFLPGKAALEYLASDRLIAAVQAKTANYPNNAEM